MAHRVMNVRGNFAVAGKSVASALDAGELVEASCQTS